MRTLFKIKDYNIRGATKFENSNVYIIYMYKRAGRLLESIRFDISSNQFIDGELKSHKLSEEEFCTIIDCAKYPTPGRR